MKSKDKILVKTDGNGRVIACTHHSVVFGSLSMECEIVCVDVDSGKHIWFDPSGNGDIGKQVTVH